MHLRLWQSHLGFGLLLADELAEAFFAEPIGALYSLKKS